MTKEQVKQLIAAGRKLYFTSEDGQAAKKNAFESLIVDSDLENPKIIRVGVYRGEYFELRGYEVCEYDSIYTLKEV